MNNNGSSQQIPLERVSAFDLACINEWDMFLRPIVPPKKKQIELIIVPSEPKTT